jgi:hypothetical protein
MSPGVVVVAKVIFRKPWAIDMALQTHGQSDNKVKSGFVTLHNSDTSNGSGNSIPDQR